MELTKCKDRNNNIIISQTINNNYNTTDINLIIYWHRHAKHTNCWLVPATWSYYNSKITKYLYSPCYSPCAASLAGIPPGGLGLSGRIRLPLLNELKSQLLQKTAAWNEGRKLRSSGFTICSIQNVVYFCNFLNQHIDIAKEHDRRCHIVSDGDPAPLPQRGTARLIFNSCLLWPNGWMDQDATW